MPEYPSNKLNRKPNLAKMETENKISYTEKVILDKIQAKLGLEIARQIMFPKENGKGYYLVDGLILDKIIFEFDGPKNHQDLKRRNYDIERDKYLLKLGFSIYRLQWFDWVNFSYFNEELEKQVEISIKHIKMLINLKEKQRRQQITEEQRRRLEKLYMISNISITGGENRIYSQCWNSKDELGEQFEF